MKSIENSVVGAFNDLVADVSDDVMEAYERQTEAAKIADAVSLDSMDDLASDLIEPLEASFSDAGEDALGSLQIDDEGLFNLLHEDARAYAESRSAELVGKKFVAGVLVDNPDAKWAIDETTRDGIRSLVESAYSSGMSPADLAKEFQKAYAFSRDRAKLIAKTETAKASVQGSLAGWKRSGVVEGKSSLLSDDHDVDDECDDNADEGVIALNDTFPSGDDGPPYHPGCNCSLVAELMDEGEPI